LRRRNCTSETGISGGAKIATRFDEAEVSLTAPEARAAHI